MQDQYLSHANYARAPIHSPLHHAPLPYDAAPKRSPTWRKPASQGLTQAQLRQIVLEQLG